MGTMRKAITFVILLSLLYFCEKSICLADQVVEKFIRPECYYFIAKETSPAFIVLKIEPASDIKPILRKVSEFFLEVGRNHANYYEEKESKKYYKRMSQRFHDETVGFSEHIVVLKTEDEIPMLYIWAIDHKRVQREIELEGKIITVIAWESIATLGIKTDLREWQ